jgi:hypothetical protein
MASGIGFIGFIGSLGSYEPYKPYAGNNPKLAEIRRSLPALSREARCAESAKESNAMKKDITAGEGCRAGVGLSERACVAIDENTGHRDFEIVI